MSNTVTLNGTGKALDLTTGTLAATFAGLTVTSSTTEGIKLTGVDGSLTANSGSLASITGDDVLINGGKVAVTYGGTITNTAGHSVNISNKTTSGDVTFNGAISDTGSGILLSTQHGYDDPFHRRHHGEHRHQQGLLGDGRRYHRSHGCEQHAGYDHGRGARSDKHHDQRDRADLQEHLRGNGASGPVNGIFLNATGAAAG